MSIKAISIYMIIILLLSIVIYPPTIAESADISLNIPLGEQQIIKNRHVNRIAVGNPDLIEVSPMKDGGGILIAGKKKGKTDIIIWGKNGINRYFVEVMDNPLSKERNMDGELLRLLSHLGVKNGAVLHMEGKRIITGEGSRDTVEEATALCSRIEGVVPALTEAGKENHEILFELHFIELSRGTLKNIGISWPGSTELSSEYVRDGEKSFLLHTSLNLILKHLSSTGAGRILARPTLVCEEGKEATFLAGGEIPVVIIGEDNREVIWKKYGIILHLGTKRKIDGTFSTDVDAEVSTIDHSSGSGDIPGFITRKVTTSFSITPGETIILSGLVKNNMIKDVMKFPLLGDIPIIGELFKSRSFREDRSELLITITPTLLEKKVSIQKRDKMKHNYDVLHKDLQFNLLD